LRTSEIHVTQSTVNFSKSRDIFFFLTDLIPQNTLSLPADKPAGRPVKPKLYTLREAQNIMN